MKCRTCKEPLQRRRKPIRRLPGYCSEKCRDKNKRSGFWSDFGDVIFAILELLTALIP